MDADARALRPAFELEQLGVFVCRQVLAGGTLGPAAQSVAATILEQELVHVHTLAAALHEPPPAPPASVREADRRLAALHASGSLSAVHDQRGALDLLYDVESLAIGDYHEAMPKLSNRALRRLAAQIMGAEAQHAAALGGLLHPGKWDRAVPVGSVQGKR